MGTIEKNKSADVNETKVYDNNIFLKMPKGVDGKIV